MSILRPLGYILLIALTGFFMQRANIDFGSIKSAGLNLEEKVSKAVENLPPPLRQLAEETAQTGSRSAPNAGSISVGGIISATNQQRAANGNLPALKESTKLNAAALAKVKDMFANQYFEHTSPSGKGPADLAKAAGYSYIMIGENLALGNFDNNEDLLQAWMDSPGHRANILNNRYTEMGAAATTGIYEGRKVWIAVQEFGLPLSFCSSPDANLEVKIEREKNDVDQKSDALDAKKKEIDNARPKSGPAYNQKVEEYNRMVADYNVAVKQLKVDIETYNKQVRAFNNCVEG